MFSVVSSSPMSASQETPSNQSNQGMVSPARALQEIIKRQVSGKLTLGDPEQDGLIWQLYLGLGKIHFAHNNFGQSERSSCLLQQYHPEINRSQWGNSSSDYQYLFDLWKDNLITLEQLKSILHEFTQEALIHVLTISKAKVQFQKNIDLEPPLIAAPLVETIAPLRAQIGEWLKLRPEISSPLLIFSLHDEDRFQQELITRVEDLNLIKTLPEALSQKFCLYQIAERLNIEVLQLAKLLHPSIQKGSIKVSSFNSVNAKPRPVIACIDDSNTVQRQIKLTLEAAGYEVLNLLDPARALTTMVRKKPKLILLDINMPEINGYDLCRQLRQSALFQKIPIVMLTGRDGNIDRLLAKMAGATDYFTKPVKTQQLLDLVARLTIDT
jgi:twitching motility two-component system response regulator PilG